MAIDFPTSPTNGQTYSYGGRSWSFNGTAWIATGPSAATGPQGAAGVNGATWYAGNGAPSDSLGVDGDFYLDGLTGDVYTHGGSVGWNYSFNIRGPQGGTFTEVTAAPSTNQNDYAPSGFSALTTQLRLDIGSSIKLTGLTAGVAGQTVTIVNASSDYLLWLEHQSAASSAANRFILPKGFPAFLMPDDSITLRYDSTSGRWRVAMWATQGQAMGLSMFTDFYGGGASVSTAGMGELAAVMSGSGAGPSATLLKVNSTEKPNGTLSASTGTTTTGRTHFCPSVSAMVWGQGPVLFIARVGIHNAVDGTQTFVVRAGLADGFNTGASQNGCTWEYRWNGSAAEWAQTAFSGAAATRSTSGSPTPDTDYICLVCFANANGSRVDMIYSQDSASFTKASSVSSGLPAAGTAYAFEALAIVKSAGTTARLATIDYVGLRVDGVRG